MRDVLTSFERWRNWMLLEHGPSIQSSLPVLHEKYQGALKKRLESGPLKTHFYFGCGYDVKHEKYADWDLCDLREVPGILLWDILLGFPYADGSLEHVKSKLTLGMMTQDQARFVIRESSRCLKDGGTFELTFRDFDLLLGRRDELDRKMFVRYIYGSGLYYGSRRRSCWTSQWVQEIAEDYKLSVTKQSSRGMNTTLILTRLDGGTDLKAFTPEPVVKFDDDGEMHNEGGDFDYAYRNK